MSSTQKVKNKFSTGQRTEAPRRGHKTREERQKDKKRPNDSKSTLDQGRQDQGKRAAQGGAEQNTNTGTPTQRTEAEPGGSSGKEEKGHARTRTGAHMP